MPCTPEILRTVPLFALLDEEERAVLAHHVEMREFPQGKRIYAIDDPGGRAYIVVQGKIGVTTIDDDGQELLVAEAGPRDFFGFASLLDASSHQTTATAVEPSVCVEVDREDIESLVRKKPEASLDMLAVLGQHFHSAQHLVRVLSLNETLGDRIADSVARFGGSWRFIILFTLTLAVYTFANITLGRSAWDPYPFILLNLFLSMLAAVQAPVIMMSQNRQDAKDRLRSELDFEVNKRAEQEIRALARQLNVLTDRVAEIQNAVRKPSSQR
jgi:CRP/FNR family cyclic AMP-dependent transcriptional regulator